MALHSIRFALSAAALASMLAGGCVGARKEPSAAINDPNEATNRKALAMNQAVFGPISRGYHAITPQPIRQGISNVAGNLSEPRIFANDLLQARLDAASKTFARFVVNSTFGVGGLFDVASPSNIPKQSGDFGQTLFVWGAEDGPYFVSPFVGPGTARDTIGFIVDQAGDPAGWAFGIAFGNPAVYALAGLGFVTQVDQLKQAQDSSIDFYSFLRSSYYQSRRAQLREAAGLPPIVESPADLGSAQKPEKTPAARN